MCHDNGFNRPLQTGQRTARDSGAGKRRPSRKRSSAAASARRHSPPPPPRPGASTRRSTPPTSTTSAISATRASIRTRAASSRRCTAAASGRCASTPASAPRASRNERFKFLLGQGQTGLSVAFDLPTQIGMDSDDPNAEAEIGQVGVAIDSLADMEEMFDGIPLDRVSTSMTINAPAAVLVAMYIAVAEKQGVAGGRRHGHRAERRPQGVRRARHVHLPAARVAAARRRPHHVLRAQRAEVQHASASAATTSATPARRLRRRSASRSPTPSRTSKPASDPALTSMMSRRASRGSSTPTTTSSRKWRSTARCAACGRSCCASASARRTPNSWKLRTHIQTGGATLTAQQPENNIVRASLQALASVLGGVQSMALSCYDEALAIPTEDAQRIALRTQQIIAHETGVTDTVDPFGGSYYVETLTERDRGEGAGVHRPHRGHGRLGRGDRVGLHAGRDPGSGRRAAAGRSSPASASSSASTASEATKSRRPVIFRVNTELAAARSSACAASAPSATAPPRRRARAPRCDRPQRGQPHAGHPRAVRAYATLGEICGELRKVWGEYRPPTVV